MKKLILIIEDDTAILDVTKQLLEIEGYEVWGAKNGQEALDLLKSVERLPNLIVLDLMMPVMDGFKFRAEQLNHPRLSFIPVVVVTAEGNRSERKDQLKANAVATKPIDLEEFLQVIRQQCS